MNDLKQQDIAFCCISVRYRYTKSVYMCTTGVCVSVKQCFSLALIISNSLATEVRMSRNVFLVSHRDRIELHICSGVLCSAKVHVINICG